MLPLVVRAIDLVPGLAIFEQGAGAGVLDIIRVRTDCENVHVNSLFKSVKRITRQFVDLAYLFVKKLSTNCLQYIL